MKVLVRAGAGVSTSFGAGCRWTHGVPLDEVRAALSAVGWHLSDSRVAGQWVAMEVVGPGVAVWAAARKAERAADEAAAAVERAEVAARAARLNALTAGHALRAEIGFVEADDATGMRWR